MDRGISFKTQGGPRIRERPYCRSGSDHEGPDWHRRQLPERCPSWQSSLRGSRLCSSPVSSPSSCPGGCIGLVWVLIMDRPSLQGDTRQAGRLHRIAVVGNSDVRCTQRHGPPSGGTRMALFFTDLEVGTMWALLRVSCQTVISIERGRFGPSLPTGLPSGRGFRLQD